MKLYFLFVIQITTDKLDEWKEVIPKAGPKYRLGKYFDTIYEIPEFDAIKEPEGGYLSCWDTDTDINTDDECNNFLFANVDGDSASVICVDDDETMRLIRRWKAKEIKHHEPSPLTTKITDRESSTKPGSDGTYEIVDIDGDAATPDEHIYESIEDCTNTPEYQIFVGNENTSPVNTPTHVTVTQRNILHKSSFKTKRANSLPISSGSSPKFARKYSDCTEYTRLRRRQSDPRPAPPLPPPNNTGVIGITSSEYSQLFRLSGKVSPPSENKTTSPPPSMILKHKGKSYVLPIAETGKANKMKRQSMSNVSPKHIVPSSTSNNNLQHPSTTTTTDTQLTPPHRYPVPRSVSMGFQGSSKNQTSPPVAPNVETTPRRKSKHNSSHSSHYSSSTTQSNKSHVKLYGVL